jgi:hypothetical protein
VPERSKHRERAVKNENLARSVLDLDDEFQVDWFVTMLFYSAVHYVDAFLAGKNVHPPDHGSRDSAIENNASISAIYNDYRRLKDRSTKARYEIANFHKNQLPPIVQNFENVKSHIEALL